MNIVAIGGGERTPHVKAALDLTGDTIPKALIVPTAASTEASFDKKVALYKKTFDTLGVESEVLHEFGETPSETSVAQKIGEASLLYTFGGNSPYMIRTMAEHGTDTAIRSAILSGKVHAGLSAGALLPFRLALSNPTSKPSEEEWDFEIIKPGISIIDAIATAHADVHDPTPSGPREESRLDALLRQFPADAAKGFAISNNASATFGDTPSTLLAKPEAYVKYITRNESGTPYARDASATDLHL